MRINARKDIFILITDEKLKQMTGGE
jgi:hypothetical protein